VAQRDERVHVEQVSHGKSTSISATGSLVNFGACGPAVKAGKPVIGSVTIRTSYMALGTDCSTIRLCSNVASTLSPGRIPRAKHNEPGITTSPFSETRICIHRFYRDGDHAAKQFGKWVHSAATLFPVLYPPYRGAGSAESARAYASSVITAAFSANSRGSTLSKVSAGV